MEEESATRWSSDTPSSEMSSSYDVIRLDSRLPTTVVFMIVANMTIIKMRNNELTDRLLHYPRQMSNTISNRILYDWSKHTWNIQNQTNYDE